MADPIRYLTGAPRRLASWHFADDAAREAYTELGVNDVERWAMQEDGTFWMLTSSDPITWQQLAGSGADLPITTLGDLVVGDEDGVPVRLPRGATGDFLMGTEGALGEQEVGWGGIYAHDGIASSLNIPGSLLELTVDATVPRLNLANIFTAQQTLRYTNALNNDASFAFSLDHTASVVPIAGFGVSMRFQADSSTNTLRPQGRIVCSWTDPTDATRKARMIFQAVDTLNTGREFLRGEASGTAAMIGFLGAAPVVRQAVTGSRGGNAALTALLTALASLGLITDSTTA